MQSQLKEKHPCTRSFHATQLTNYVWKISLGGKKKKIISGCFRYYYLLLSPSGSATCFTELIKEYFQLQASRTTEKKASTEIKRQK